MLWPGLHITTSVCRCICMFIYAERKWLIVLVNFKKVTAIRIDWFLINGWQNVPVVISVEKVWMKTSCVIPITFIYCLFVGMNKNHYLPINMTPFWYVPDVSKAYWFGGSNRLIFNLFKNNTYKQCIAFAIHHVYPCLWFT